MISPLNLVPPFDFDRQMQANLARVFSERDADKRLSAIAELYAENAVLFEPDTSVTGHAGINSAVTALMSRLPPDFKFTAKGRAIGHHGLARLHWQGGPSTYPSAVTGTDIAHFEDGLIRSLHVFIEPAGA